MKVKAQVQAKADFRTLSLELNVFATLWKRYEPDLTNRNSKEKGEELGNALKKKNLK